MKKNDSRIKLEWRKWARNLIKSDSIYKCRIISLKQYNAALKNWIESRIYLHKCLRLQLVAKLCALRILNWIKKRIKIQIRGIWNPCQNVDNEIDLGDQDRRFHSFSQKPQHRQFLYFFLCFVFVPLLISLLF
jgi:thiosulfate reductase cytochrome b subunit